ncbi:MAG: hypothetical protein DRQ88_03770 [Epsilonproteobacteria bacterium]|nr:MAG: hypothetical protein DRQ89_04075 [Campylobacterota bacterium]RLA67156.1 MAG: hypothetical protein DRQ88_03770 [Campylobacterota bacterium]
MDLSFFEGIQKATAGLQVSYNVHELITLLGHSTLIGIILCFITYFSTKGYLNPNKNLDKQKIALILGTTNILYLCTGLTAVMILVNNNLARAFSIGAAIALVRFRIKLGRKGAAANILFGIIGGIACGLNEITLAWLVTCLYLAISMGIYLITRKWKVFPLDEIVD